MGDDLCRDDVSLWGHAGHRVPVRFPSRVFLGATFLDPPNLRVEHFGQFAASSTVKQGGHEVER